EGIWLLDDDGARGLHPLEFALHVGRLDVPDEPARLRVLAMDLAVRPDRDHARPELPAAVAALDQRGLAEDLAVVVDQAVRVVRADEDVVELHVDPPSSCRPKPRPRDA